MDAIAGYNFVGHVRHVVAEGDVFSFPPGLWELPTLDAKLSGHRVLASTAPGGPGGPAAIMDFNMTSDGDDGAAPAPADLRSNVYLRLLNKNPSAMKTLPMSRVVGGRLDSRSIAVLRVGTLDV